MKLDETPEWKLGEIAVRQVRQWMIARDFYLLPTDQIDMGGAPRFIGKHGGLTVPDILAASRGKARWVEVKWKTSCRLHQRTGTWRHGVDLYNWEHYLNVQKLTSIPGWLAIVQLRPGPESPPEPMLLMAPFDGLAARTFSHDGGGDVKAWWDVDSFLHYPLQLSDDWRSIEVARKPVRPWERTSKAGDAPRWRAAS